MHSKGLGLVQDYKEGVRWYRLAAEQGYLTAQLNLGYMYFEGKGVLQDYKKGHMLSNLSSFSGSITGGEYREIAAKKMTTQQISDAQKMASEARRETIRSVIKPP